MAAIAMPISTNLSSSSPPSCSSSWICRASLKNGAGNLPPISKEETIEQARASLWAVLEAPLKRRAEPSTLRKISKSQAQIQQQSRFRIEIPVLDGDDRTLASLALDLLANAGVSKLCLVLPTALLQEFVAAEAERRRSADSRVLPELQLENLQDDYDFAIHKDAAFVLIVAPGSAEIDPVGRILGSSGGRAIVVLNPEWSLEEELVAPCDAFQVAYSFIPLSIRVFLSRKEGAVLKEVPLNTPWRVFLKEGSKMDCVLSLSRRPSPEDLENALYNRVAASSPVVKSAKFLSGLFGKN
ncbi:uncharacterized protein LOC112350955 [Selaginella moellendorffii]|uniref:uncharacterized protein LOC112350955 n=1 Tax=Selaginella moellendorffii TaxID=88036 RepID=UPI000D1C2216|nr:uncharacterized protein LOC112350955 [Selaginella moellendorffii]|eukprot:XP_024543789.1 uncharacterized protein LOC112350955 [Selaginella moellendorffii]